MSPILILSILLQVTCGVHAVRTGRPLYWLFILLIGSFIGVAIYLIAEVLPEMRNSPGARKAAANLRRQIDPDRDRRNAANRLELSDTQENRRRLAEQCLASGDYRQALDLYRSASTGLYADDPHLMLGMARAQFELGDVQDARQTFEALIAAHPNFHSFEGHLLYARAIAASGDTDAALQEYATLADAFPGEEARVRYGLLLKQAGQTDRAAQVFRDTLRRADLSPSYYRQEQKLWLAMAKRELA